MPEDAVAQMNAWMEPAIGLAYDIGIRLLGAIALWIVGRFAISMIKRMISKSLARQSVDVTLTNYVDSAMGVLLNVILLVMVLSVFGVETTTFAGLLAAGGVAIGMAWSGLLAHFAAGAFLLILRPFKVGDMIEAGGIIGNVVEIGLFATAIDTPDNVRTILGNNTIFSGNILNFSTNPHRRVELTGQLAHGVDHADAIERLRGRISAIPNVMSDPAPGLEILEFNLAGPVLAVRPHCHNDHYWQVYFDTNRVIRETFGEAGYPVPEHHYSIKRSG